MTEYRMLPATSDAPIRIEICGGIVNESRLGPAAGFGYDRVRGEEYEHGGSVDPRRNLHRGLYSNVGELQTPCAFATTIEA